MKKIVFLLSVIWAFVALTSIAKANGGPANQPALSEGEKWIFRGTTKNSVSSSTDRVDGEYILVYKGGQIEVTQEGALVGGNTAEELKRMVLPDEREYLKFPLELRKKWVGTHTQQSGRRKSTRSMEYVVAEANDDIFKIEGNSSTMGEGGVIQKRIIIYSLSKKAVTKYFYDSSVDGSGAKIEIELTKHTAK